jgi:hypothetical protein
MNISTENIQTTVGQLNNQFSGRRDSPDYDENKLVHIHRRNRPFVWNKEMLDRLLDSILKGYYVPPIICSSTIVGGRERREVMEGGNRITTFRKILSNEVRPLTALERLRVESHPITVVVMRGMTSMDQRVMFRRLNKNVKVTDGQLYSMSEEDSPLVQEALALLNDDNYPLRDEITTHFFDTRDADNDGKRHLENALALVSGCVHGPDYITKSYNVQEPKVESQEPVPRHIIVHTMSIILGIFSTADARQPLIDKRKRRGQWSVGKWLGAMLYDYLTHPDESQLIQEKWATYIVRVRRDEAAAEQASLLGGAQNLTATRYKRICTKVEIYLRDRRVATDEELAGIRHEEEEDDDESVMSDERED